MLNDPKHTRLVLPGPVEVRREILEAQTAWMIGHRTKEFADLYARLESKLQQTFLTENLVIVSTSSGTGLWEGVSRNCIREGKKALHLVNGAFSDRWSKVSQENGKQVDVVEVPWGEAVHPDMVAQALASETYDAVCVVHNETSTGVLNPVAAIGEVVRKHADTLFCVDCVSSFLGAELRVDAWGIDVALTSSQKAFALPPGLSFATLSERTLARAEQVTNRGYYFDFLELAKYARKNNTPATPPVSLMFAADVQLDSILEEGIEARWRRHETMQNMASQWALDHNFGLFAEEGYRSPTVTTVANTRGADVAAMAEFMRSKKGFAMDTGYGKLKGETFRIPHMGDLQPETLQEFLDGLTEFLGN